MTTIKTEHEVLRALIVAATGGHHMLISSSDSVDRLSLVKWMTEILPDLSDGTRPPLEAPHYSASISSLLGGGARQVQPGYFTRASDGILFLDNAPEFTSGALDALRQPLEVGYVQIHRAGNVTVFPATFQLVLGSNLCPCGLLEGVGGSCPCPPIAIRRYRGRLSGPILDRIDINLTVAIPGIYESTDFARERVAEGVSRTIHRLRDTPWVSNAHLPGNWLRSGPSAVPLATRRLLDEQLQRGALTLRGYDRILRVAWTVADLAGHPMVTSADIELALSLRGLR